MQKKTDIVYHAILSRIEEEFWKPGQQIFSERQLAELYSVSRVTVRHAVSQLVGEGYLEYLEGRTGTFVRAGGISGRSRDNAFVIIALDSLSPAFASNLLGGIHEVLWKHGYRTAYCNTSGDADIVEKIESCIDDGAKGILFSPLLGDDKHLVNKRIFSMVHEAGLPLVQVDRYEKNVDDSRVQCNNYRAMKKLSERLMQKGCSRPLVVKGISVSSTEERLAGIRDAFGNVSELTIDEMRFARDGVVEILDRKGDQENRDVILGLNGTLSRCAAHLAASSKEAMVTAGIASTAGETPNDYCVVQPLFHIGYDAGLLLINEIEDPSTPATHIAVDATIWPNA